MTRRILHLKKGGRRITLQKQPRLDHSIANAANGSHVIHRLYKKGKHSLVESVGADVSI